MAKPELKPCPFCGSAAAVRRAERMNGDYVYFVACTNANKRCVIQPITAACSDMCDAIEAWNTRYSEKEGDAL